MIQHYSGGHTKGVGTMTNWRMLNGIEALVLTGDWQSAATAAAKTKDEAQRQKASATNRREWREFLGHADCLCLSIRAQDQQGCVEQLTALRLTLAVSAGPEHP
jgi:hypothetical protein